MIIISSSASSRYYDYLQRLTMEYINKSVDLIVLYDDDDDNEQKDLLVRMPPWNSRSARPLYSVREKDLHIVRAYLAKKNWVLLSVYSTVNTMYLCHRRAIEQEVNEHFQRTQAYLLLREQHTTDESNVNDHLRRLVAVVQSMVNRLWLRRDLTYEQYHYFTYYDADENSLSSLMFVPDTQHVSSRTDHTAMSSLLLFGFSDGRAISTLVSRWTTDPSRYCSLSPRVTATVVRCCYAINDLQQGRRCRASNGNLCTKRISTRIDHLRYTGSERGRHNFSPFKGHDELAALLVETCSIGYDFEFVSCNDQLFGLSRAPDTICYLRATFVSTDERW